MQLFKLDTDMLESLFWLFILFIWAISAIAQKGRKKSQKQKPADETEEGLLRRYGFVFPKPPEKVTLPPIPEKKFKDVYIPAAKKKVKKELEREPIIVSEPTMPAQTKTEAPNFATILSSYEKLQEGIVLSVILGPPKAYKFCKNFPTCTYLDFKNR